MNYFMPFSYNFSKVAPNQNKSEIKFQISIKKRLFDNMLNLGESYYIAYTQTSWWQAYNHSSPFRENNYKPEFFVNFPMQLEKLPWMQNVRLGILHESNGKSDESLESRSWNRIYLSSVFLKDRFLIAPRVWLRIPENEKDDDNPDIEKYLGNFDLNMAYLGKDFFINAMVRNNLRTSSNKGAVQIDIGYDLFDNGIFWYVQYFNGYGESLIDYNKYVNKLSTGFLISY
ncbi:phospholipase A [Campylobacter jejuni]|nr:phospholipase A [Campylobacter jejuni]